MYTYTCYGYACENFRVCNRAINLCTGSYFGKDVLRNAEKAA